MGGGGAAGGGGSGAGPAATQYMPQAQPQADTAYQGIVSNLFPYANNPASTPAGVAYSTLQPYATQLANQDLINQGMQGAQNAYTNYTQGVYPAAQNLGSLIPGGAINSYIQAQQNPYSNQALAGAQTGAGYGGQVSANELAGSNLLFGGAGDYFGAGSGTQGLIQDLAPQAVSAGQGNYRDISALASPATTIGGLAQQYLQGLAPGALATGGATQQAIQNAMVPLQGLSSQVLNTAFDPQQALYDRTQQQVVDQARAASAAAGLSSSPYGAGVENQATENFNIDWQNQQLARQAQGAQTGTAIQNAIAQMIQQGGAAAQQGIGAAGNLYGAGAGLAQQGLTSAGNLLQQGEGALNAGLTTGANLYGQGLNALLSGAQTGTNMLTTGGALGQGAPGLAAGSAALPSNQYYGNLQTGTAVQNAIAQLAQSGLNIGTQGAQGLSTFAGQPYSSLGTAINNILTPGISNAAQLGQQEIQFPQQVLQDLQSYLGLGQAASLNSGYLGNLGLQQTSQALSGIGSALGGVNSLFGNSGALSGLFGGAGAAGADVTGLLSPAASAAFPAFDATTQTLLSGGGAAATGGGIGDFLGSILPFGLFGA